MVDFKKKLEELKELKARQTAAALETQQKVIVTPEELPIAVVPVIPVIPATPPVIQPVSSEVSATINPAGFLLKQKVEELNQAMLSAHPRMPVLLKEIWLAIRKQPEQVTVLSPEETHVIFQGIERQTGVFLATSVTESKGKSGTSSKMATLKKLGADAF